MKSDLSSYHFGGVRRWFFARKNQFGWVIIVGGMMPSVRP